jgi:hypothetical protein
MGGVSEFIDADDEEPCLASLDYAEAEEGVIDTCDNAPSVQPSYLLNYH